MNLHEYQGKALLKKFGVSVPEGIIAMSPEEALDAAKQLQKSTGTDKWAVKAQIHAGGRGKGGGVKIAKTIDNVLTYADQIIGMQLVTPQTGPEGKKVRKVLIEQNVYYPGESETQEFYLSVLLNRQTGKNMIMYSPRGGMDIEKVAEETPEQIFTEEIDPGVGLQGFQARRVAFNLGLSGNAFKHMVKFVGAIYKAYLGVDASLFEINARYQQGPFTLKALFANWSLNDKVTDIFAGREKQKGYFIEPSYRFGNDNQFGLFTRYSYWDNNAGDDNSSDAVKQADFGMNYWLTPTVVFKADYQNQSGASDDDGFNLGVGYSF